MVGWLICWFGVANGHLLQKKRKRKVYCQNSNWRAKPIIVAYILQRKKDSIVILQQNNIRLYWSQILRKCGILKRNTNIGFILQIFGIKCPKYWLNIGFIVQIFEIKCPKHWFYIRNSWNKRAIFLINIGIICDKM